VHVDVETAPSLLRGTLVGSEGRTVEGEDGTRLIVPAGALASAAALSVAPLDLGEVDAAYEGFPLVAGAAVDLGGATLAVPASLSLPASLPNGEHVYGARLLFVEGRRRLKLVGRAAYGNGRIELSGADAGGTYLLFQSSVPLVLVSGTAREGGAPAALVSVESSSSPFMDVTEADGRFLVAASSSAPTTIAGRSLRSGNFASESITTATDTSVDLDLVVSGPYVTGVAPADGQKGVGLASVVSVQFSEPVRSTSVTAASLFLARESDGTVVSARVTMGAGQRSASILPDAPLAPATIYRVSATADVTDSTGNPLLPFTSRFTTVEPEVDAFDADAIAVTYPDADGLVSVSAPSGSFEGGAFVVIVNLGNGVVVSGDVLPDGGFSFSIRASIRDELQIRVVDAAGREATISKTEYRAPDGRVAIGTRGGRIASGDFELDVPDGALGTAVEFRLTPLTEEELAELPVPEGAGGIGSALRIEMGEASLAEEAELAFPIPASAPEDALFLVLRSVEIEGELLHEVVDTASIANGKVETDSEPFPGVLRGGNYSLSWYPLQPNAPRSEIGLVVGVARGRRGAARQAARARRIRRSLDVGREVHARGCRLRRERDDGQAHGKDPGWTGGERDRVRERGIAPERERQVQSDGRGGARLREARAGAASHRCQAEALQERGSQGRDRGRVRSRQ
jgi:hypothetical protein